MLTDISGVPQTPDIFFHPYICGIGGIGTSGVALLIMDIGVHVMGSDLRSSEITDLMRERGAEVYFSPCPDKVRVASCVIIPSSFPVDHPELVCAREHHVPILDRTQALGLFCHYYASMTTICFGTLNRGKLARALSLRERDAGWCTGVVTRDNQPHARFGSRMFIDLDERDIFTHPELIRLFPNPHIVISDIQSPDYGYYPSDFSFDRLIEKISSFSSGKCPISSLSVQLDERDKRLFDGVQYAGLSNDPSKTQCLLQDGSFLNQINGWVEKEIQVVGWFESIPGRINQYHDIRMHPVSISSSLSNLRKIAKDDNPIALVIKPFISTLYNYSIEIWSQALREADDIYIISPPYEGCSESDCIQFAQSLSCHKHHVDVVSLDWIHMLSKEKSYWLWSGAPDILPK